jgi:WbqC-like protein family
MAKMKLALMQPYFFPYIGYFELIYRVDQWIVFDIAQYIKLGWVNRNRILHPVNGWQYIIVPCRKHNYQVAINDIQIVEDNRWRSKIFGQIQHYSKKAPFFKPVTNIVM